MELWSVNRKLLKILLIAFGLIVLAYAVIYLYPYIKEKIAISTPSSSPTGIKMFPTNGQLPQWLPQDIVMEKDVRVLRSSYTEPFTTVPSSITSASDAGTMYQIRSVFGFASQKTLAENFALYSKYFQDNKWKILASTNEPSNKRLQASKGYDVITIIFALDSKTKDNVIDINGIHFGTLSALKNVSPTP